MSELPGTEIVDGLIAGVLGGSGPSQALAVDGRLLVAGPDGFHRILDIVPDDEPPVPLVRMMIGRSLGTWTTIRDDHRLDRLGPDRVVDWIPSTGQWRLWSLDASAPDPLPDLLASGTWTTIGVGHHLVWLGDSLVLDWQDSGHWRLFTRDDALATGDPLPGPAISSGDWTDIGDGHRIVAVERGRIVDHDGETGVLRVFGVDSTVGSADVLRRPALLETTWIPVGPERELIALSPGNLMDWDPRSGAFRIWRSGGTGTTLRIRLLDINGKPFSQTRCELDWDGQTIGPFSTTVDGVLEVNVPALKVRAFLTVFCFPDPNDGLTMQLFLTDFGPPDQLRGARARLSNLGYEPLKVTDEKNPEFPLNLPADERTRRGIQRFQSANGLVDPTSRQASGSIDAPTAARLLSAHDTTDPLIR